MLGDERRAVLTVDLGRHGIDHLEQLGRQLDGFVLDHDQAHRYAPLRYAA
jgi:hypothetical protein